MDMTKVEGNTGNNNEVNNYFNVTSSLDGIKNYSKGGRSNWLIPMLRLVVFVAMVSATLLMALDQQTSTMLVAIGNISIPVKLVAKSKYIKSYVFFVIANAVGSLCTLMVLLFEIFGNKLYEQKLQLCRSLSIILDMVVVALVSVATGGATFVGEMAREGNTRANWQKVCDKFESFCNVGIAASVISYFAIGLLIIINAIIIKNQRN